MALTTATAPLVVLLLLVAAGGSGGSGDDDDAGWSFDTMIGCAPAAAPKADDAAAASFRAGLAPLLAALPSAAAATGFAALPPPSASAGTGGARAVGLCFGPAAPGESGCEACLQDAVAAVGLCACDDVRSAGAWRPGCAVVYSNDGGSMTDEDGGDSRPRFPSGDTRAYADTLDQTLADLAKVLAQAKPQPLWKTALSALFYVLAAIGAVTVLFLLCVFLAGWYLAETLARNMVTTGLQLGDAGAGEIEGIAVYVAASNGPAPIWSMVMQLRFH